MKPKQLANVLIRLLGLSVVVHDIPAVVTGLANILHRNGYGPSTMAWFYPVSSLVLAGLGVYLIVKSRCLADWLFWDETE